MNPVGGELCKSTSGLEKFCNAAAKKNRIIHLEESLDFSDSFPKCEDSSIHFSDVSGETTIRILNCSSAQSPNFSIGRGLAQYDAYEYNCFRQVCKSVGNIEGAFD